MSCPRLFEPVEAGHLASCAECRAAQSALDAPLLVGDVQLLKGSALAELRRQPRAFPWWAGALGIASLTVIFGCLAMAALSANTVQHRSEVMQRLSATAWAVTMVAGCFAAVMPGARRLRIGVLAAAAGSVVLTVLAASGQGSGSGVGCAITEFAVALLPMVVAMGVMTGFAFDAWRMVTAGVATVSAGVLAVHLHCPNGTLSHQVFFHLLPVPLFAGATVLVRRVLPSRTHAP